MFCSLKDKYRSLEFFIFSLLIFLFLNLKFLSLKKLNLINKNSYKLKILGSGQIKDKIDIEADLASKSAIEKLEKIGGSIQLKK